MLEIGPEVVRGSSGVPLDARIFNDRLVELAKAGPGKEKLLETNACGAKGCPLNCSASE
jgi:hypothetical protein